MIKFKNSFILIIIIFQVLIVAISYAQDVNNQYGATKGEVDTLGIQKSEVNSSEALGLLEKEVDADKYIVGPGDAFQITIITSKSINYELIISPQGQLIIPIAGVIDLKAKTLSQAISLIEDEIKKVYKTSSVIVTLKNIRKFKVIIAGSVFRTGIIPATAMERVSEVIDKAGGLRPGGSNRNIKLYRDGLSIPINIDLEKFFLLGDKESNPCVLGGDQILVPPVSPRVFTEIYGEVISPGRFELKDGDSLSTVIKFALGFTKIAFLDSVELVRFKPNSSTIEKICLNLKSWQDIKSSKKLDNDIPLMAGDRIYIRSIPEWLDAKAISIKGEIRYPGRYAINENITKLRDIIDIAGGFTPDASLENAILIRQSEQMKEDRDLARLAKTPASEMTESELRYFQVRSSERRGLMSINFHNIITNPQSDDNILLRDNDSIYIPMKTNTVNVQGRVNNPGLVTYKPNYSYEDYIALAGGYGFRADISETNIVKSKGQLFLAKNKNYKIEPGDNILVPPEKEIKFIDVFTTGLTITMQMITIIGVVLALIR